METNTDKSASFITRLYDRATGLWQYCSEGVWEDHRDILKVNIVKTLNLTVRTFFSTDLQSKACAMTYRTMLAIVPALALLFAIGRGFGFQTLLQEEVYKYLPSQHKALEMAFRFVDSTLAQASEGIFVGVGIIFLLWTIISLLDSVEETFNGLWGVTVDRSIFRKVTDYLAICIILPILMICSGGFQVMVSSVIQQLFPDFLSPFLEVLFDCLSYVLAWLFFAGAYMLIPNTKVGLRNALIAGTVAGTAFQILQWLFLSGQLYVSKYNAIYGSFSFLPLLLIWMQLSWLITLAGALICCAAQNISMFSFDKQTRTISIAYRRKVSVALLTIIVKRFENGESPLNIDQLSRIYSIPVRLVTDITGQLLAASMIVRVIPDRGGQDDHSALPFIPAHPVERYTLDFVNDALDTYGSQDFLKQFDNDFAEVSELLSVMHQASCNEGRTLLADIPLPSPASKSQH